MTTLQDASLQVNSVPLAAAHAAEQRKHATYDTLCHQRGLTMIPFSMEIFCMRKRLTMYRHMARSAKKRSSCSLDWRASQMPSRRMHSYVMHRLLSASHCNRAMQMWLPEELRRSECSSCNWHQTVVQQH